MPKKILIITEYFYPEEFKINEIALEWHKKGHEVSVITNFPTYPAGEIYDGYENRWYQKDFYEGVTVFRVKSVTGYKSSFFKKLLKYFVFMFLGSFLALKIGKKYDSVFGFDIAALTSMVPAVLLKKFYKKDVTLWIQDVWPDSVYAYGFKKTKILSFLLDSFVRFVYKNSTNFAVSGKGFKEKVRLYSKNKEIKYFPNWADEFDKSLDAFSFSKEEKIHLTFAGNVGKVQNLTNIIIAFSSLEDSYLSKAQLNIIGDGSELETLKKFVTEKNYKNIIFWGRKPRKDMYMYFQSSDFLIVSLVDEPIFSLTVPAKLQTYIAANRPILAILNGDASDIVKENNLGYTAKPNMLVEIENIFIKAISADKSELKNFTKNCKTLTETTFNKQKIINNLLEMLRSK